MSDTLFFAFMGIGFFAWLLVHGAHQRIDKLTKRIEELEKSQVIPDGTEKDFRDLLDFACTTTAKPVSPREPKDKPETSSAPKAE